MKFTKILCVVMTLLMLISMLQLSAFASVVDVATTKYAIEVTSYDQLKNLLYNSPNGELFVLANDIIVEDNDNDNEIIVGASTNCTLDLNGYTLKRTTRGIDSCLIKVNSGANFDVADSSDEKTGKMIYCAGNYAGTNSVIIANGDVDIFGGCYEITTPYEVGGGTVFMLETGQLDIYNGVFDSHTAFGGDTITMRHNAYMYDVPHCNIFDGTFYGKISNFEVSSYDNYTKYGCYYPSAYVLGGEFYIANPDDEYAGFAYCNNGWGRVVVAGGTVFAKCLNSSDQIFTDDVVKNYKTIDYNDKKGTYYEVSTSGIIGCEDIELQDRLLVRAMKTDLSIYGPNSYVYKAHADEIDAIRNHVDTAYVSAAEELSPLLWIESNNDIKTVSWYMADEAEYCGEDTNWSELTQYRGRVNPFHIEQRPAKETVLYIRAVVTKDDNSVVEDVIAIEYEQYMPNPPISSVSVTGVDAPKAGDNPDFSLDDTDEYYINAVYWKDTTTNDYLKETDVFETGHTYELEVWLRTKDGYKFKTDSDGWIDITATIGGKNAEVVPPGAEIAAMLVVTYTLEEEDKGILGDVNLDESVTIKDATVIQMHLARKMDLSEQQLALADTDKNGKVTILDATRIQLFIAKIIPEL